MHYFSEEGMDEEVLLFVKMVPGQELTHTIQAAIVSKLRNDMSPRHVPNKIYAVDDIPVTISEMNKLLKIIRFFSIRQAERRWKWL